MGQGYFPPLHKRHDSHTVPEHLKHDVVFIGTPHDRRVQSLEYLIDKERLPVTVYGGRWNRLPVYYRNKSRFFGEVTGEAYAKIISGSKIALGYVSSSNLDEFTNRSFEIPACGGLLLAERTPSHLDLYHEGAEAEFFSSDKECAEKIKILLRDAEKREALRNAGHQRCLQSDYSLVRCVREAVEQVMGARGDSKMLTVGA